MVKLTVTILVAVLAVQGAVWWILPVPAGMEAIFFAVSTVLCLTGVVVGAGLGSLKLFSRQPWGVLLAIIITLGGAWLAYSNAVSFFGLYHLGGVPEDFEERITRHYAQACFFLFFLFGFIGLERGGS